uniref:Uncharacterized protein n=1 Tax=Parastrongyloides trichosuri TaxID=131310 RepID=A0A0N4ZJC3_PARTI
MPIQIIGSYLLIVAGKIYENEVPINPSKINLFNRLITNEFKFNIIQEKKQTKNLIYHLPYREHTKFTTDNFTDCETLSGKKYGNLDLIYVYIFIESGTETELNSEMMTIIRCSVFLNGYRPIISIEKVQPSKNCQIPDYVRGKSLVIFLNEISTAYVIYDNILNGIEEIKPKHGKLCAFLPADETLTYLALNVYGKVYPAQINHTGSIYYEYHQTITFLNENGDQNNFLSVSSESSLINLKPFIEVNIQVADGFSFFSKKTFDIASVTKELMEAVLLFTEESNEFNAKRKKGELLPIHRYAYDDVKDDISEFEKYVASLD